MPVDPNITGYVGLDAFIVGVCTILAIVAFLAVAEYIGRCIRRHSDRVSDQQLRNGSSWDHIERTANTVHADRSRSGLNREVFTKRTGAYHGVDRDFSSQMTATSPFRMR
jgi:hypothetical protein